MKYNFSKYNSYNLKKKKKKQVYMLVKILIF